MQKFTDLEFITRYCTELPVEVARVAVPGATAPGDLLQGRALASPRLLAPAPPPHSLADPAAHTKHYYFNLQVSTINFFQDP